MPKEPLQIEQEQHIPVAKLAAAVYKYRPVLESIVSSAPEGLNLKTYIESMHEPVPEGLQSREDFIALMTADTERIFGPDRGPQLAAKMRTRLTDRPVIVTANHTALVDCFPLTTQSTLLAAMGEEADSVVPILAGGGIPGDNAVDPLGPSLGRMRVQQTGPETDEHGEPKRRANDKQISATKPVQVKFNVVPWGKYGRAAILTIPAMKAADAQKQLNSVSGLQGQHVISWGEKRALETVLGPEVLQHPEVQAVAARGGTLSEQAMVANNLAFKFMFAPDLREEMPELIFGEFERISGQLLASDIENSDTLAHQILFDENLRQNILANLNGVPGCWDSKNGNKEGTQFFWGFDQRTDDNHNSPVSLQLVEENGQLVLRGRNTSDIPFTPTALAQALREKRIIPGLFMGFTALSFARGIKCYGGFMQTDYLTHMREGLVKALNETAAHGRRLRTDSKSATYNKMSAVIGNFPTENYILGMTPVLARYTQHEVRRMETIPHEEDGQRVMTRSGQPAYTQQEIVVSEPERIQPAGTIEIIARGGLTREQWKHIQQQPFVNAGALALPDTYGLVVPQQARKAELTAITSSDIYSALGESFVTLDM